MTSCETGKRTQNKLVTAEIFGSSDRPEKKFLLVRPMQLNNEQNHTNSAISLEVNNNQVNKMFRNQDDMFIKPNADARSQNTCEQGDMAD